MRSVRRCMNVSTAAMLCGLLALTHSWSQEVTASGGHEPRERSRLVISQPLPNMHGDHLKVFLEEVVYGPGEASPPHSHPCPVMGYVVEGAVRTQVKGEPERVYRAGDSFYEARDGIHLVSANASSTESAKLVAYLICDRDAPLSLPAPDSRAEGKEQR
jgi:quercetin dioxygenase-like cupin family protein